MVEFDLRSLIIIKWLVLIHLIDILCWFQTLTIRRLNMIPHQFFLDENGLVFMQARVKIIFEYQFWLLIFPFSNWWFWFWPLLLLIIIKINYLRHYIHTFFAYFVLVFVFNWTLNISNGDELVWAIILLFRLLMIFNFNLIYRFNLIFICKWLHIIFELFFFQADFEIIISFLTVLLARMRMLELDSDAVINILKARRKLVQILFVLQLLSFFIFEGFKHGVVYFFNDIRFGSTW